MSTPISSINIRLLLLLSLFIASCAKQQKTGYVDMFKLVSEFELQKEYSEQARRDLDGAKAFADSMIYAEKLRDPARSESLRNSLYAELSRKTEARNKEIETMIWKRLNPYLTDYGKEKGYTYIYGANGTGNVLYADESQDITAELIEYVNNRYHDKK